MVTITNIAQRILDENNYTVSDINKTNLEYLIDNAIDYVNLEAGTTIADLTGVAESKSLVASENEVVAVKALTVLMVRAYKDRGPNMAVGGLNVAVTMVDPQYSLFTKLINKSINRLRSRSFVRT